MKNRVSIITVNYNGEKYLETFLASVRQLNYPKDLLEVLVVDNGSTDNSVDMIEKRYPEVRVIRSPKNSGFGGGNNLGMKAAKGELFFLVNNDTALEPDSLKNIVKCFLKWSKLHKVGAVTSKLVLFDKYIQVFIRDAYLQDFKVVGESKPLIHHIYQMRHDSTRNVDYEAYLPVAYDYNQELEVQVQMTKINQRHFIIKIAGKTRNFVFDKNRDFKRIKLKLTQNDFNKAKRDLIQNAGNFYFRDGFGRDRGALIYSQKQYYESDFGQYDKEELVPGFCGAGVLLPKSTYLATGGFDKRFFMYYEDGDLSLRIRKSGMKILYCPSARIRHVHTGSSSEWSDFFIFNVERNRLLFMSKHWPILYSLRELLKYVFRDTLMIPLYHWLKNKKDNARLKFTIRMKVVGSLLLPFVASLLFGYKLTKKEIKELY